MTVTTTKLRRLTPRKLLPLSAAPGRPPPTGLNCVESGNERPKPQAELPQQQWIVDQDIIPMVTVHDGFHPLPRRPHRCSPLFEPVDNFLRGIAYLKTAYVSDKLRHLARLKVFAKVL